MRSAFEPAFMLEDTLPLKVPPIHILDIGAMVEGDPIYAPLIDIDGTRITGFEPQEEARKELEQKYPQKGVWHGHALGDGKGHTFYRTCYPGCSSLFVPNADVINSLSGMSTEKDGNFEVVSEEAVTTHRLDDLDDVKDVDFAKLDVQGAELMILKHGMEKLGRALVIQTEAAFLPLYEDQPTYAEQHLLLAEYGFNLHKLIDTTGRTYKPFKQPNPTQPVSQFIEADAVFVRRMTRPETLSADELLKASQILHNVYNSYDLTHRYLETFDQKSATNTAKIYYDKILASQGALPLRYLNPKLHV